MTTTGFTHGTRADVPLQRFEVFTGTGRCRDWSDEEKDRIVAQSYSGEMSVSAVARPHGLSPGQLFTWRRQVRSQAKGDSPPMFVPAVIDRPAEAPPTRRKTITRSALPFAAIRAGGWRRDRQDRIWYGQRDHCCRDPGVEGSVVIGPSGAVKVMIATKPVDFRKGAEGLAALVKAEMGADLFSATIYVFHAKRRDRIKLIFWDGSGVCLVAKGA